jgi:hypothetical protein
MQVPKKQKLGSKLYNGNKTWETLIPNNTKLGCAAQTKLSINTSNFMQMSKKQGEAQNYITGIKLGKR